MATSSPTGKFESAGITGAHTNKRVFPSRIRCALLKPTLSGHRQGRTKKQRSKSFHYLGEGSVSKIENWGPVPQYLCARHWCHDDTLHHSSTPPTHREHRDLKHRLKQLWGGTIRSYYCCMLIQLLKSTKLLKRPSRTMTPVLSRSPPPQGRQDGHKL